MRKTLDRETTMHPVDKAVAGIVASFKDVLNPYELIDLKNSLAELADYIKGKRTLDQP